MVLAIVFGGPSAEHDISILTGLQAERILSNAGQTVQPIYWARNDSWYLVPAAREARDFLGGAPKSSKELEFRLGGDKGSGFYQAGGLGGGKRLGVTSVLNCLHGGAGEAGGAQWLFELAGIKATGATPAAAALGMDKLAFGAVVLNAGLPSLPRELLSKHAAPSFAGLYIVKPRGGGSSIGIEANVADYQTALALLQNSPHLRAGAVVEPYRPDLFDLNVSVRTYPTVQVSDIERPLRPGDGSIYDYSAKYVHSEGLSGSPREFPAQVSAELTARIKELVARVVELTGLTGVIRIDFLSDGTEVYINEPNSIPGAMALYLWPDTAAAEVLLGAVTEAEQYVPQVARNYQEGVALQAAGGIASKLHGLH